jgi:hypothetical protein
MDLSVFDQQRIPHYSVAKICVNGHLIAGDRDRYPELSTNRCQKCGEVTITGCQHCSMPIRGNYYGLEAGGLRHVKAISPHDLPHYCPECGQPYPWTRTAVQEALLLAEQVSEWDRHDREAYAEAVPEVIRETPKTPRASATTKRLLARGGEFASRTFERITAGVLCEMAKREIFPPT